MSTDTARCSTHEAVNGRHYCEFAVDDPGEKPDTFSVQPSPLEYERLVEHSTAADEAGPDIGVVPVVDDDGWEIDWAALDGA